MPDEPLSEYVGLRVTTDRKERIQDVAETYRVDESEVVRRLIQAGERQTDFEALFAEELQRDREREGIEA